MSHEWVTDADFWPNTEILVLSELISRYSTIHKKTERFTPKPVPVVRTYVSGRPFFRKKTYGCK